jgi:hypothetical protein
LPVCDLEGVRATVIATDVLILAVTIPASSLGRCSAILVELVVIDLVHYPLYPDVFRAMTCVRKLLLRPEKVMLGKTVPPHVTSPLISRSRVVGREVQTQPQGLVPVCTQ